ncbi:hypothetical protein [Capsulimonas corticalis]|uniref:hypothetical protein n=1 Tax=Capsulimonas corticalis TaxID=2219043 RepID=UPI00262081F7|nr:hypothetical protein [Capsulimonas corticalis]
MKSPLCTWRNRAVLTGALAFAACMSGCAHHDAAPSGPAPIVNAPAGAPNHMTPEMQAQIEHYKSLSGK